MLIKQVKYKKRKCNKILGKRYGEQIIKFTSYSLFGLLPLFIIKEQVKGDIE